MNITGNTIADLVIIVLIAIIALVFFGLFLFSRFYRKTSQGQAMVRTGFGGVRVSFNGILVVPVLHRLEIMDISLKSFTLERMGKEGLICKDNMRADIKVTFFISVNSTESDVKHVAMNIGTARASDKELLINLFDAKFSEALKTVGKDFEFTQLYSERDEFKKRMLKEIGQELNGYSLDSAAIDYLEQTKLEHLDPENILDAEGIKKITELTAEQHKRTNLLRRDEEKVITQQDVEAKETILDLNKQLEDKEANQQKDIAAIRARTEAETLKIQEEERLKSEKARIATEEELEIAEQKKQREVIIELKRKEAIEAKQNEIVEKEKQLEANEREKVVALAQIEKTKEVEIQKRDIQGVIKSRIELEKETVTEEEKIKDTRAFADAEREKKVAITQAEQASEEALVQQIKAAEASKKAAEIRAEQDKIEATTLREVADKKAESKKIMADADAEEKAAIGLSEAKVTKAKAEALQMQGESEANVIQQKAEAEAEGIRAKKSAENEAYEEQGKIDAKILEEKGMAESKVIEIKADSVKKQGLAEAEVMA
ncbi:MAG: flotillin family protein, partial [Bacteroidota bacterium]